MKAHPNYANYNEIELWEALKRGHQGALEYLHQTYFDSLYSYGLKIVRDEALIESCVQEVFVSLWRLRHNLGAIQSIKAYLIICFRRNLLKKQAAQLKESQNIFRFLKEEPSFTFSPEDLVIAEEVSEDKLKLLAMLLSNLTDRQKEIIYLRYYEDLPLQQIAALLAINTQSVANHLQRAFEALRKNKLLVSKTAELLILLLLPYVCQLSNGFI